MWSPLKATWHIALEGKIRFRFEGIWNHQSPRFFYQCYLGRSLLGPQNRLDLPSWQKMLFIPQPSCDVAVGGWKHAGAVRFLWDTSYKISKVTGHQFWLLRTWVPLSWIQGVAFWWTSYIEFWLSLEQDSLLLLVNLYDQQSYESPGWSVWLKEVALSWSWGALFQSGFIHLFTQKAGYAKCCRCS